MDADTFWTLVADTRAQAVAANADSVVAEHVATLTAALEELPDHEVREFYRELRAVRARANSWNLWAAAYLALGGASDDSFLDFRNWVISHGRETYERVLADPDSVADLSWDEEENDFGAAELWAYAPLEVLEERGIDEDDVGTGDEEDLDDQFGEPTGEPFPSDDDAWFAARFPRLWAKYGDAAD
jgi:Protein of unknown function (DUF4240)